MKIKSITKFNSKNEPNFYVLWTNQKIGSGQEYFIKSYQEMKNFILSYGFYNYKKGLLLLEAC